MTQLVWWHLSGLRAGTTSPKIPLETIRDALSRELRDPPAGLATPDLLLIAGDLTAQGKREEFVQVFNFIDKILDACEERSGKKPLLFFVPGPRDLAPPGDDSSYDWFYDYDLDRYAKRREALWGADAKNEYLQKIEGVFHSYSHSFEQRCLQQFPSTEQRRRGWMPGDALASVELGGLKLGLVGLNSAWRRCGGGDSALTVDPSQLHRLLKDDGLDWKEAHDLCLLLQHHAPECLEESARKVWEGNVEPPFGLGLFASEGEPGVAESAQNGHRVRSRVLGGCLSAKVPGFVWGQARRDGDVVKVRVWPRKWVTSGEWSFTHGEKLGSRESDGIKLQDVPVGRNRRGAGATSAPSPQPAQAAAPVVADGAVEIYVRAAAARCRELKMLGFEGRNKLALDIRDVYIDLMIQAHHEREAWEAMEKGGASARHRDEPGVLDLRGVLQRVEEKRRAGVVLLGEPGAGKTTLLLRLLVEVAEEGSEAAGLPRGMTPVLLRFSCVRSEDRVAGGLARVLRRELGGDGYPLAAEALAQPSAPVLFLLDGLDEMRDEETRVATCAWLNEEIGRWPSARFVATCRFSAWTRDDLLNERFLRADVLRLSREARRQFVTRWYGAVERKQGAANVDATLRVKALLTILEDADFNYANRLQEMASTPLLLSTLCLLHHEGGELPKDRGELYNRCIRLLLELWNRDAKLLEGHHLSDQDARPVLEPLAWAMQTRGVRSLSAAEVKEAIRASLSRSKLKIKDPEWFLGVVHQSCGVLAAKDVGVYEFLHLTFQEYLAAAHVQRCGLQGELAIHITDAKWHEVIRLSMGFPGVFRPFMQAVLRGGDFAEAQLPILTDCLREAALLDPEPFLERLRGASPPPEEEGLLFRLMQWLRRWFSLEKRPQLAPPDDVGLIFSLFANHKLPEVEEFARALADTSTDRSVRLAARAFLGLEPTTHPSAPTEEPWTDPVSGIEFVWVPPGRFWMGSNKEDPKHPCYEPEAFDDELPGLEVEIQRGYWIGRFPVTNEVYSRFLKGSGYEHTPDTMANPKFNPANHPVSSVNWDDAMSFCQWLSSAGQAPKGYRFTLPTEAQWERAARGTDGRKYPWGKKEPTSKHARFGSDSTAPVGAQALGVSLVGCHDMAGNVWEWCADTWVDNLVRYMTNPGDICHEGDSSVRVLRGGAWLNDPGSLRCAFRGRGRARDRYPGIGFRVACVPEHA